MSTITSTELVQVRFTVKDGDDEFVDALYFTPAEREGLTPEQLEAMQLGRFNNWKEVIQRRAEPPTEERMLAEIAALEEQRAAISEALAAKTAELALFTAKSGRDG